MRNGFGLRLLHKFLGLPFLQLKRQSLLAQIEKNVRDKEICVLEMTEFLRSDNADYTKFLDNLVNKRREVADQNTIKLDTIHSATANGSSQSPTISKAVPTKSIIIGGGKPIVPVQQLNERPRSQLEVKIQKTIAAELPKIGAQIRSVDDFCPDDGSNLDRAFLDDVVDRGMASMNVAAESDSDGESRGNPLVAHFDEDYLETIASSSPITTAPAKPPKVNPLSKTSKNRSSSEVEVFNITSSSRRSSSSSLDLKTNESFVEFDSDSSKLVRRSPDGIEDTTTLTPANCSSAIAATQEALTDSSEEKKEKKKSHKKKSSKETDKKGEKKKSKKKKSKELVSTSEDDLATANKEAYEII